ncbi:MAG: thioredoxin fold domain-containing protein [Rhodoferax sp.]|nr:thioredoxin fold domain-containing protein [Rhodoferax sp.]
MLLSAVAAGCLALLGCSKQESASAPDSPKRAPSVEIVAAEARGFTVGAMMSTNAVYVFFDPQCPHCAHLWQASAALQKKVKFIWIPVGIINASSTSQGAALLASADPARSMDAHESSLLAGTGGISASASPAPEMEQAIKANTRLFNNLGAESVPFIVARNVRTGQTVTRSGSMQSAALAELLGLELP